MTASPVPRPPHNTGRDPHPDTHISGEVDRVQRSIGYLITTARINVASRQLGAPFRRLGASSSRRWVMLEPGLAARDYLTLDLGRSVRPVSVELVRH